MMLAAIASLQAQDTVRLHDPRVLEVSPYNYNYSNNPYNPNDWRYCQRHAPYISVILRSWYSNIMIRFHSDSLLYVYGLAITYTDSTPRPSEERMVITYGKRIDGRLYVLDSAGSGPHNTIENLYAYEVYK